VSLGVTLNDTYVVEAVLGEGGMGRVYRARHTRISNKLFAVKVLRAEFTRNAEVVARFRREAEAAACVTHPNVIGVVDVDVTPDGYSYLVCEYLAGIDLADELITRGRLSVARAVHVVSQVCAALEATHARNIVHRDIKPHNVFLLSGDDGNPSELPEVKVLDFGLSRFVDATETQLTRAGVIMGTPAYMSPEQAEGHPVDHRTDVYGTGAVLYAALTGKPPYEAESLQAILLAVLKQKPPQPRVIAPEIPENLELIVQRAMARDPEERYQSMAEMRQALEGFAASLVLPESPVQRVTPRSRLNVESEAYEVRTARPRLLLYGLLTLAAGVAGLSSVLSSLELFTGKLHFTRLEVALILLGIAGTLLTPALLLLRRIRENIWNQHARVLQLLANLKETLGWAVLAYGSSVLLTLFLDAVVGRFEVSPLLGHPQGVSFAGWNLIWLLCALLAGAAASGKRRLDRVKNERWARLGRPGLYLLTTGLGCLLLYAGLVWRGPRPAHKTEPPPLAQMKLAREALLAPAPSQATESPVVVASSTPAAVKKAPLDELARASAKGTAGLLPLSERYPKDPDVLRPLLFAFASRATGLADAMVVAQRLFDVAPENTQDPNLKFLVKKAATTPGQASKLALVVMATHMGSAGPDILYDLLVNEPKLAKRAKELLDSPEVTELSSPALLVALALRDADTCAAKGTLIERAAELGDQRSSSLLLPLVGSRRGCGKWRRYPCPAKCPKEAAEFRKAIAQIVKREAGTSH